MRAAVLGAGVMGSSLLTPLSQSPHVSEVIAHDVCADRVAELSAAGVRATTDLSSILDDETVELVYVTAPNDVHAHLSIEAMRHGKAVMCESPMALNLAEAQSMVDAAEETNGFLQIGFELRYSALYQCVKRWVDEGLLGRVVNLSCTYTCSEFWREGAWRTDPRRSGGMVGEKLSHYLDIARWWSGREVAVVTALAAPNVIEYFGVHDNCHLTYRMDGDAVGHLSFMMGLAEDGTTAPPPIDDTSDDGQELRYRIVGTKGWAETDIVARRARRWEFGRNATGQTCRLTETHAYNLDQQHANTLNTTTQALDIADRVARRLPPRIHPHDALATMRASVAAEESVLTGRPTPVD